MAHCSPYLRPFSSSFSSPFSLPFPAPSPQFGDTPLIFATKENCVDIVLKLIEHGADVNAKDKVSGEN
jgi:ankyrin repeat protein